MTVTRNISKPVETTLLAAILLAFVAMSVVGITWGLPSRKIDKYLFGDDQPWPGQKIYHLAGAADKFSPDRGADVDVDPLDKSTNEPVLLTATQEDVAKIYLRYRLYTYQPDEMITMMALAGMNPRELDLDPRLYQYGGLFIYPVGALIGACGLAGLIDVRSDVAYYLDNPDEFGKFYVVARAYSAAWGLVGVAVVFAIARRLAGSRVGLLAALLFALMPVVVCMAHEGKPHLPGAVLMLAAVLFAMRHLSATRTLTEPIKRNDTEHGQTSLSIPSCAGRDFWLMCICCGAALGMVLSSWPIFVLIPVVALLGSYPLDSPPEAHTVRSSPMVEARQKFSAAVRRTSAGTVVAMGVYLATNPYLLINALTNREVLASNFGNSFAMYEVSRIGEGFLRVLELTVEGATLPIVILGVMALMVAVARRNRSIIALSVPAAVFFLQFVMIGAGKPAEYGRFGIFTNTALAIGAASLLARRWTRLREIVNWVPATFVVIGVGFFGAQYLRNFHADTTDDGTRLQLARGLSQEASAQGTRWTVGVTKEPAPYCCPPLDFSNTAVSLVNSADQFIGPMDQSRRFLATTDRCEPSADDYEHNVSPPVNRQQRSWWIDVDTPISWANKPFRSIGDRVIGGDPEVRTTSSKDQLAAPHDEQ